MYMRLEDFKNKLVVVPKFEAGGYGITKVDRGNMTDSEWNLWRKVDVVREIAKLKRDYSNSGQPVSGLSKQIISFLDGQGITACLTGTVRPVLETPENDII